MLNYKIYQDERYYSFFESESKILSVSPPGIREDDKEKKLFLKSGCQKSQCSLFTFEREGWAASDLVERAAFGVYKIKRTWINKSETVKKVQLFAELALNRFPDFYMIPCVSYDGNEYGQGGEPKGLSKNGYHWVHPYDKTGVPSATFSENKIYSVGMFASWEDEKSLISSCSMLTHEEKFYHRIYWPKIESPYSYSAKNECSRAVYEHLEMQPNEEFEVTFYVVLNARHNVNMGWTRTYDFICNNLLSDAEKHDDKKIWENSISYVKDSLFEEKHGNSLINIGLLPDGKHNVKAGPNKQWKHRKHSKYEIGWCGQNISLAHALIQDYKHNKNRDSLDKAVNILRTWTSNYDPDMPVQITNNFNDKGHVNTKPKNLDTCNLGWGAWQLLECYDALQDIPGYEEERNLFFDIGLNFCNFVVDLTSNGLVLGKTWSPLGERLDSSGTIGIFLLLPLMKASKLTRMKKYLEAICVQYRYYSEKYLDKMVCVAGALDTNCVDKETCWPFLKVGLDLYEITKDDYFLKQSEKAAYYLLSWMFHFNVPTPEDSDFNKYGYQTLGATSVSVQHHHLDPWGALISHDWRRLGTLLRDDLWEKRADITWDNAMRCISDGDYEVHGMKRPKGSQNEAYFQNSWAFEKGKGRIPGEMNDWLVAWPCAFRLLTLINRK